MPQRANGVHHYCQHLLLIKFIVCAAFLRCFLLGKDQHPQIEKAEGLIVGHELPYVCYDQRTARREKICCRSGFD